MNKYATHLKYEAFEYEDHDRQSHKKQRRVRKAKVDNGRLSDIRDMDDGIDSWVPTYVRKLDPRHHERQWVIDSVGHFYMDNVITDVTRLIKGGKEANVYCCTGHPNTGQPLIAAKLYRPRMLRNLKNDALYKVGRQLRDAEGDDLRGRRERVAMKKKTRFGKSLDFSQWIGMEHRVLIELYEAGADVPKPIAYFKNTLLMAFVGDENGPAPTLSEVSITPEEAAPLFEQVMENIRLLLHLGYVHGDLSAYNILYWEGKLTLIDFPQMVNAYQNPHAFDIFERDIQRVCDYFAKFGVEVNAEQLAHQLWEAHIEVEL